MFNIRFLTVLLVVISIVHFGTARAHADQSVAADALTYAYYDVRGTANLMVVNDTTAPGCTIPVPTGKQVFTYTPVEAPVVSCNPAKAKPLAVGSVAHGGNVIDLMVDIGPFAHPVDISLGIFSASFDAADIFFLNIFNQITSLQDELAGESLAAQNNGDGAGSNHGNPRNHFKKLVAWRSNVLSANETIVGPIDTEDFPPGLYLLVLNVTKVSPAEDNFDRFYRWVTFFIVPDPVQ